MIQQSAQYVAAVEPLFAQSEAVERHFLDLAGQMTQNPLSADEVAQAIQDNVLPASEALIAAAGTVSAEAPKLVVLHADLEDAWRERDDAWRQALAAWSERDAQKLALALEARQEARDAEERYIFDVNAVIRPYGQRLTLLP